MTNLVLSIGLVLLGGANLAIALIGGDAVAAALSGAFVALAFCIAYTDWLRYRRTR